MAKMTSQTHRVSVIVNATYEELPGPRYSAECAHRRWWLNAFAERQTKGTNVFIDPRFFRIDINEQTLRGPRQTQVNKNLAGGSVTAVDGCGPDPAEIVVCGGE